MPRNPDPKHGRWILPLIITAMVVLTFTFVNSLDPAEREEGETTVPEPPFPTTPTSTATTLPPETQAFLVTLNVLQTQATEYQDQVNRINDDWEADRATFTETREAFLALQADIVAWEEQVAALPDVPPELAAGHVELVLQADELGGAVEDIVIGLDAPDTGEQRRAAVEIFAEEMQDVLDAIQDIRDTAEASTSTDDTDGDGDTTTSTTEPEE